VAACVCQGNRVKAHPAVDIEDRVAGTDARVREHRIDQRGRARGVGREVTGGRHPVAPAVHFFKKERIADQRLHPMDGAHGHGRGQIDLQFRLILGCGLKQHQCVFRFLARAHLDAFQLGPGHIQGRLELIQAVAGQETGFHCNQIAAVRAAQGDASLAIDHQVDLVQIPVREIARPVFRCACIPRIYIRHYQDISHGRLRQPPQPVQLVRDDLLLELSLPLVGNVLPLAAATQVLPEIGTGRLDPVRAGLQHPDEPAARPTLFLLQDLDGHAFSGYGVRHEYDLAGVPADRLAAMCDGIQGELDDLFHLSSQTARPATPEMPVRGPRRRSSPGQDADPPSCPAHR